MLQDGRLKVHDQLLSVNGESLMGMDNKEAIDLLKTALIQHGKSGQASVRAIEIFHKKTSHLLKRLLTKLKIDHRFPTLIVEWPVFRHTVFEKIST